jgi:prophage regulatory protein
MSTRTRLVETQTKPQSAFRPFAEASQRVLLQMRVVRDSLRNLLTDFEGFEAAIGELQRQFDENQAISPPPPVVTVHPQPPRVMRIGEVASALSLCRSTIYRMMQEDRFPKPLQLSGRPVGWRSEDIDAWLAHRR